MTRRAGVLLLAALGLIPAARADEPPAALGSVAALPDAAASGQKATGLVFVPAIGSLQHPTVRLWDELRATPRDAPPPGRHNENR